MLTINTLCLMEGCSLRGGGHLLEHPQDPGEDPFPSIWDTDEVCEWEKRTDSCRVSFDQCMFGAPTMKPTTGSSALDGVEALDEVRCDRGHVHERSVGLVGAVHLTRRLASYPSDLCSFFASLIILTLLRFDETGSGPTGWMRSTPPSVRISSWSTRLSATSAKATATLNELAARGRAAVIEKGQAAFYLHVDDGVFIAERGTDEAASRCISTVAALEEAGFDVPNVQADAELLKVIGIEPERSPARLRLPADRAAMLQSALRHLVSLAVVDVAVLRSLVGVWVWAALLRRDLLCIPAAIFKFMDAYEGQVTLWWRSARREAACMATAIGAFYADLGVPLAPVIFATDAMGASDEDAGGFGIVAKNVGSRLARTCYELGRRPGYSVTKLSGEFTGLKSPHDQIFRRIPFTCLPRELLEVSDDRWKRVDWGRWRYADHIRARRRGSPHGSDEHNQHFDKTLARRVLGKER